MAEVTAMRNNVLEYPIYGLPYTIVFPMLDADGDLVTGATAPDAEISKNGDTFVDCVNESTEIAPSSGMYYLTLTSAEMAADVVAVIAKSATTGMKTTPIVLYPRKLAPLAAGMCGGGSSGYVTLDASASSKNDYYNGCVIAAVIDGNMEVRVISDYTGSTKRANVVPNWNTVPDSADTFVIYQPETHSVAMVAGAVWDEQIQEHTTEGSYGVGLYRKQYTTAIGSTTTEIVCTSGPSTDEYHTGQIISIVTGGSGNGGLSQSRRVTAYNGTTRTFTVDPPLIVPPAAGVVVRLEPYALPSGSSTLTADDVLDEDVEGAITLRQTCRAILALISKVSGGGTATVTFRDSADTKDRIVIAVDSNGNRSSVTLDLT